MNSVLIIDDDRELCELVKELLEEEGFKVETISNSAKGLERALTGQHTVIVLDVMMPGMNGLEVLRRLRAAPDKAARTPVMMLTAKATGALERIERESRRINEMIGQLLTLIRGESDADGLRQETVDLSRLVTEVSEDADFEARSRNRTVHVLVNDECRTTGTYTLLRSAVENVIRNAVHYTDEGTTVEVSHERQGINGDECGVITVRDHGPGVPEDMLADIFRPFYRVEEARDPDSGGTGLGLAITARAVSLHNGTIRAFNAPDRGLIVEMRIPVRGRFAA